MRKRAPILVAMAVSIAVFAASAAARPGQSGGEVIVCTLRVTQPALPPSNPTGKAAGTCAAFGPVNDVGSGASTFTLVGNPPKAVHGVNSVTFKTGTISGNFQGSTAPVSFKPGTKPVAVEAVAIAKWTVVKATGSFARFAGKSGVNAAYQNNATKTLKVSILLP